jgi:uroporphyrinogen-III decarboxylase
MTHRERLFAFLRGEQPDRVPIWMLFPFHPVSYYANVRTAPSYAEVNALADRYAVTLDRRGAGPRLFAPEVASLTEEVTEGDDRVRRHTWALGDLRLTCETRVGPTGTRQKAYLDSEDDLDTLLALPIETDPDRIAAAMAPQIETLRAEEAEFPRDAGAFMLSTGEPIGPIYHMSNLEELAIWSLTAPEKMATLLERLMVRERATYRALLDAGVGDVYFMVGSELASPPMVSRTTFQRRIVPYAQELIAMVHDAGKYVIQHYHGQIGEILPDFLTMGPDALHTIEAPPVGNCTLTEAFEVVGDRIGLIGNIQYDEFERLTPDEMEEAVRACLDETRGRRFMLSPSAGPYEAAISPRVQANYRRFIEAGWRYGGA